MRSAAVSILALSIAVSPAAGTPVDATPGLAHGVASGDVTATSAVLWARADAEAAVAFEIDDDAAFGAPRRLEAASAAASDFAVQVTADGLLPSTRYHYRVRVGDGGSAIDGGSFVTAAAAHDGVPVRFIVGGDVGGQGYCRHVERGYQVFQAMAALAPDVFIANGDMIYGDNACPAVGPGGWSNVPGDFPPVDAPGVDWSDLEQVSEIYLAHWRYNRADEHHKAFLRRVPMIAQWDDHEVINDFGAAWDSLPQLPARAGYRNLVAAGRDAFFAWNPIRRHPREPGRVYRSFRFGRHVELFLLDARSYRGLNDAAARPEAPKPLLGEAQLAWLLDGLSRSDASWKIVSSDVPLRR